MGLSRESILDCGDLVTREVKVKEWGGSVRVRMLDLGERMELESKIRATPQDALGIIVCYCACDDLGTTIFRPEDVEALKRKSSVAILRVSNAAMHLNKLTQEDLEEVRKNSEASRDESTVYDSRHILG